MPELGLEETGGREPETYGSCHEESSRSRHEAEEADGVAAANKRGPSSCETDLWDKCVRIDTADQLKSKIVDEFDAFIFDIDGVLLLRDDPVPRAADAMRQLLALEKKIFIFTNNSNPTPEQIQQKLVNAGFPELNVSNIYGTTRALSSYLTNIKCRGKIYLIGNDSIEAALRELPDVQVIRGHEHATKITNPYAFADEPVDMSIEAVVMGFDLQVNYYKLAYAHRILTQNPKSLFVTTNKDLTVPTGGFSAPGTGTFITALEYCTNRKSIVVGKPSPFIAQEILQNNPDLRPEKVCMVGDNLQTDIPFGRRGGIGTVLVETGVSNFEDALRAKPEDQPHFVVSSVGALFE